MGFRCLLRGKSPWMWPGLSKMRPSCIFQPQGPLPPSFASPQCRRWKGPGVRSLHLVLGTWLFLSFREQARRVCAAEDSWDLVVAAPVTSFGYWCLGHVGARGLEEAGQDWAVDGGAGRELVWGNGALECCQRAASRTSPRIIHRPAPDAAVLLAATTTTR